MSNTTLNGLVTPYDNPAGTTLTVDNGNTLTLLGTIANHGTIAEDSTGDYTLIAVASPTVTLNGGGAVVLSTEAGADQYNLNVINSAFDPSVPLFTLVNVDNTIAGSGEFSLYSMVLDNQAAGVIDGNGPANNGLDFYGTRGIVNAGLIEATGAGGIYLSTTVDQTAGGTILASGATSVADLYTSDIIGGTLKTTDLGQIMFVNGTIDGSQGAVTIATGSSIGILSGYAISLIGTIDNRGTILDTNGSVLSLASPVVTLTGGGAITLGGDINGADATAHLLVNLDNTITGGGFFGIPGLTESVTNDAAGVIDATDGLTFQLAEGTLRNIGLVEATNGGSLTIKDAVIDNAGGTLVADGSTITLDHATLTGGIGSRIASTDGGAFAIADTSSWGSATTDVDITAGTTIIVTDATLNFLSSTVVNAGTLLVGSTDTIYGPNDIILNAAHTTLSGGGTIELDANYGGSNQTEIIGATATPVIFENVDNLITGFGSIGSDSNPLALVNDAGGTIVASAQAALTIDTGTATLRNAGLLESTGRPGLILQSATIDNDGGTILTDGSALQFESGNITIDAADILGGTLSTVVYSDIFDAQQPSGTITFAGGASTLDGRASTVTLTDLTPLSVGAGSSLELLGSIAWQGATLAPTGSASNAGVVTGFGTVAGDIANTGRLVAQGGIFDVVGSLTGAGSIAIGSGATFELGGPTGEASDFQGQSGGTLILDSAASYTGALANITNGDTLQLGGADVASAAVTGDRLIVTLTNASVIDYDLANPAAGISVLVQSASASQSTLVVQCFAQGTRLRTVSGDVAVEDLQAGDRLISGMNGSSQAIRWIGHRAIDCARHPKPQAIWPVEIAPHAFGPGQPARPLRLSPDHAVFLEGVLIPIKHLIDGKAVRQLTVPHVTYFHVELDRHEVILAEGLPSESYLDTGDRAAFAGGAVTALQPVWGSEARDITLVMDALGAAPLRVEGPEVERTRARLRQQNHAAAMAVARAI